MNREREQHWRAVAAWSIAVLFVGGALSLASSLVTPAAAWSAPNGEAAGAARVMTWNAERDEDPDTANATADERERPDDEEITPGKTVRDVAPTETTRPTRAARTSTPPGPTGTPSPVPTVRPTEPPAAVATATPPKPSRPMVSPTATPAPTQATPTRTVPLEVLPASDTNTGQPGVRSRSHAEQPDADRDPATRERE